MTFVLRVTVRAGMSVNASGHQGCAGGAAWPKDGEPVCRHSQCDLHTTTNIQRTRNSRDNIVIYNDGPCLTI